MNNFISTWPLEAQN